MNELEARFHQTLLDLCDRTPTVIPGYYPTEFRRMVEDLTGVLAMKALLKSGTASSGFKRCYEAGHLELTGEYYIANFPEYWPHFEPDEVTNARWRLENAARFCE